MNNDSLENTKVSDILSKVLITVDPLTTVFQAAKMMEQSGIGALLVKKDGISGIITDRDYAIKIVVNNLTSDTPVEKVATFPLITINANESILDAATKMISNKIRKLAVVDGDTASGIITTTDIIKEISKK
jgi:CBS domain-containing protein